MFSKRLPADSSEAFPSGKRLRWQSRRRYPRQQQALGNALSGLADHLFYPALMLLATPWLAATLGLEEYGLWMLANAFGATLGCASAGLGEATVKYVAEARAKGDYHQAEVIARTSLGIYGLMALLVAFITFAVVPWAVDVAFNLEPEARERIVTALRLVGAITAVRMIEGVFISTLRGYERYDVTAFVTMTGRLAGVGCAVALASQGYDVRGILAATLAIDTGRALSNLVICHRVTGFRTLAPAIDKRAWALVYRFASYSSLGATGGALFSHLDRVLIGVLLGPRDVAVYTLCTQLAQQTHSLSSAGLNFLFPLVSRMSQSGSEAVAMAIKRVLKKWLITNVIFSSSLTLTFVLGGGFVLSVWLGDDFPSEMPSVLAILAVAFGVLAINVVSHYALLGLGDARFVAISNLGGGIVSTLAVFALAPVVGLLGAACARLLYGLVVSVNYLRLAARLK